MDRDGWRGGEREGTERWGGEEREGEGWRDGKGEGQKESRRENGVRNNGQRKI